MAEMTVQIVTPDGLKYDHHAKFILVKTPNGELGVLANHENLIAPLEVHEMKIKRIDDDSHVDWVAVNGGIIEIKDNLVTIVADSAERERDIDIPRAQRAKQRAERLIQEAKENKDSDTLKRAEVMLHRAMNRLKVSQHQ